MFVYQLPRWRNQCLVFGVFFGCRMRVERARENEKESLREREMLDRVNKARNYRICTMNKTKSVFCSPFVCLCISFVHWFHSFVRLFVFEFGAPSCCSSAHTYVCIGNEIEYVRSSNPCRLNQSIYVCDFVPNRLLQFCVDSLHFFCVTLLSHPNFKTIRAVSNANQNIHRHTQKSTHHTKCMPSQKPTAPMSMTKQRVRSRNGIVSLNKRTNEARRAGS